MPLCDLTEAKDFQSITTDDRDDTLDLLIDLASNWIETECGRKFSSANYTEYYSGSGTPDLILNQRPVTTLTSIYLDSGGYYGQGSGAFASTTLLTAGTDYALVKDDPGTAYSKSGIVRYLFGGGANWPFYYGRFNGMLSSGFQRMGWPVGEGNIKVVYVAGWSTSDIPKDLKLACLIFVQTLLSATDNNRFQPISESVGPFSTSYGQLTYYAREVVGMKEVLRKYRETPL